MLSPALLAAIAQDPLALLTLITPVTLSTAHPVDVPALNVSAPPPLPPVVVAVPVLPYVMLAGTERLNAVCIALFNPTASAADVTGL